jgi:hypothetical protein
MNFEDIVLYWRYILSTFLLSGRALLLSYVASARGSGIQTTASNWNGQARLAEDAVNPAKFEQHRHGQAKFLDRGASLSSTRLDPQISNARSTANPARPILPREARRSRLAQAREAHADDSLVQSDSLVRGMWLPNTSCRLHVAAQHELPTPCGCPTRAADSTFRSIKWNQRSSMWESRKRAADDSLFAHYRACQFSRSKARGETSSPPTPCSRSGARSQRDIFCLGDLLAISMGLGQPQNRGHSRCLF